MRLSTVVFAAVTVLGWSLLPGMFHEPLVRVLVANGCITVGTVATLYFNSLHDKRLVTIDVALILVAFSLFAFLTNGIYEPTTIVHVLITGYHIIIYLVERFTPDR